MDDHVPININKIPLNGSYSRASDATTTKNTNSLVERVLGVPGMLDQLQDLCNQIEAFEARPPRVVSPGSPSPQVCQYIVVVVVVVVVQLSSVALS